MAANGLRLRIHLKLRSANMGRVPRIRRAYWMIITDGHEYEALRAQHAKHTSLVGRVVLRLLGFRGQVDPWGGDPDRFGETAYHSGTTHLRPVHEHEGSFERQGLDEHLRDLLRELEHLHAHLHEREHPDK